MKLYTTYLIGLALALSYLTSAQAQQATVRITTTPGDAKVYVDGARKGTSPSEPGQTFAIKLDEGEYLISAELEADGQVWRGEKEIFVGAGVLQDINLNLSADLTGLQAGDTFTEGPDLPTMVVIPAGSFMMGSPPSEPARQDNEGPQQRIRIRQAFALSQYEVTFRQWDACVADGGCSHRPDDEGWGRGNRPVINVSWDDAQEYIGWINDRTDGGYSLPSEAQWEYAARAGTTTPFWTGQRISTDQANFNGNYTYNGSREGTYRRQTVPVGSFEANSWGLYDVHGNVWEWMQDCWVDTLRHHPESGAANLRGDCSVRVLRGGSWFSKPKGLRSAYRLRDSTTIRYDIFGFRLLKTL